MARDLINKNVEENDMSLLCQVLGGRGPVYASPRSSPAFTKQCPQERQCIDKGQVTCVTSVPSIRRKKQGRPHQIIKVKFYLCPLKMISGQLTYHSYAGPAGFLPASARPITGSGNAQGRA